MKDLASGKRVSAKEAASILGVPYANISRIDRACAIIQRFKLGHKTYVYDLDSLYRFLASCQSKPLQKPDVGDTAGSSRGPSKDVKSVKRSSFLQAYLPEKRMS
jgi:hypothetical protein